MQSVIRALIDRLRYLQNQIPCWPNRVIIAALVLAGAAALLAACSGASRAQLDKAAADTRKAVNAYCDARAKAIEALGEAGAP